MKNDKIIEDQVFNLMDALRSPVLTNSSTWADCIPKRLLDQVPIARLASLISNDKTATDVECVAFIMTRTMEAPMTSEWVDIYTHLSCKVCEQYFNEDHWEAVMAPRKLSDYQNNHFLKPLRRHIYDKRRKVLKERLKSMTALPVTLAEQNSPVQPEIVETELQLTLF